MGGIPWLAKLLYRLSFISRLCSSWYEVHLHVFIGHLVIITTAHWDRKLLILFSVLHYMLRFILRLDRFLLRSTPCYLAVHTCIPKQAPCMKTRSNTPAIISTVQTVDIIAKIPSNLHHYCTMTIVVSYPVRLPPCCVDRNVRYGPQSTHREESSEGYMPNCKQPVTYSWLNISQS